MATILVLLGAAEIGNAAGIAVAMPLLLHRCCTAAAAGRQARPTHVFSRAIAAILP